MKSFLRDCIYDPLAARKPAASPRPNQHPRSWLIPSSARKSAAVEDRQRRCAYSVLSLSHNLFDVIKPCIRADIAVMTLIPQHGVYITGQVALRAWRGRIITKNAGSPCALYKEPLHKAAHGMNAHPVYCSFFPFIYFAYLSVLASLITPCQSRPKPKR